VTRGCRNGEQAGRELAKRRRLLIQRFEPLPPEAVSSIVDQALDVLCRVGVAMRDAEARSLLGDHGARVVSAGGRAFLPHDLVERARATAPSVVRLFDRIGTATHEIGGNRQYFAPGSSAPAVHDEALGDARPPRTADYVEYAQVVSALPHIAAQSTAFVPADVPAPISDSYRLYLSLLFCAKPIVTGTFSAAGLAVMRDLLLAVRGTAGALAAAPLAVFSCCPTSPLVWGEDATQTLMGCARSGIPVEIVPMALAGFNAPVRLGGTLVQHTAEALAGVVLSQLAAPGAPLLFGGASTIFDIRHETTPMGAGESILLACGAAQIGRHLGLPTQAYIALSDAKGVDAQAGLETGMGAALAALAGINEVSGPGLLEFGHCFSTPKLVVDHEACAMAVRLRAGITPPPSSSIELLEELLHEGHLLIATDTRRHLREEITFPGETIDRENRGRWIQDGARTLDERAAAAVAALVKRYEPGSVSDELKRALAERMGAEARRHGMEALPALPCEP
jgi:trimethylamine--corrinoid protein Co-methyltransferase